MDINNLRRILRKTIITEMAKPRSKRIARRWNLKDCKQAILSEPWFEEFIQTHCMIGSKIRWKESKNELLEELVEDWIAETGVKVRARPLSQSLANWISDRQYE